MEPLKMAERVALERYDGHYTLMKFTTNWRFCFGTLKPPAPTIEDHYKQIQAMHEGKTMDEAILKALVEEGEGSKKDG